MFEFGATSGVIENAAFDPAPIREIRFVFDVSPKGAFILDGMGFSTSPVVP